MEVTVYNVPYGGGTITTTRVFSADGKLLDTTSQRTYTYIDDTNSVRTTTTSYDKDDNETGSTSHTTVYDEHGVESDVTVNKDSTGHETSTVKTVADDGSQVIQDKNGKDVVHEVHIGAATPGVAGMGETPAKDAIAAVTDKYDDKD